MTEAMPFLQKFDITFLRPPTIRRGGFLREPGRDTGGRAAVACQQAAKNGRSPDTVCALCRFFTPGFVKIAKACGM